MRPKLRPTQIILHISHTGFSKCLVLPLRNNQLASSPGRFVPKSSPSPHSDTNTLMRFSEDFKRIVQRLKGMNLRPTPDCSQRHNLRELSQTGRIVGAHKNAGPQQRQGGLLLWHRHLPHNKGVDVSRPQEHIKGMLRNPLLSTLSKPGDQQSTGRHQWSSRTELQEVFYQK